MIFLRKLQVEDAPYMIEWMHDDTIANVFQKNMRKITLDEAKEFCIKASKRENFFSHEDSVHFAIIDDYDDEYRGTISLKDIDIKNHSAEYAISIRRKFHGSRTATEATRLILDKAFMEYGLHRVYLNVLELNSRAIGFYEKIGFSYEGTSRESIEKDGRNLDLKWYSILKSEWGGVFHKQYK